MSNNTIAPINSSSDELERSLVSNADEDASASAIKSENVAVESKTQERDNLNSSNDNAESYMVLSINTSEATEETLLTDNLNIQSNISTDKNSLASVLSCIEEKLSDVLLENMKLKSILKQKDDAIRKQFTTIVILEKEVIQVCENYKKKFSATKHLVRQLKEENDKLHAIITSKELQDMLMKNNLYEKHNSTLYENTSIDTSGTQSEDGSEIVGNTPTELELRLTEQLEDLSQKLNDATVSHLQAQSKLKEVENQRAADLEQFDEQLRISQHELEVLKQKIQLPNNSKLLKLISENYKKELERKYLVDVITTLEQRMRVVQEKKSMQNFQVKSFIEDMEICDKKLCEFIKYFVAQCAYHLNIDEFSKECIDVIQIFENAQIYCDDVLTKDGIQTHKDKFCDYRKILIDEQLQTIKDERTTLNVQRQFLKVLADYNIVVSQLETLKYDIPKLINVKMTDTNIYNLAEIEKCLLEEKKISDSEKGKNLEERLNIEKEKQMIQEERELLEVERTVLVEEKDQLLEESRQIENENMILKQRTAAYNRKIAQQKNNASFEIKFNQTTSELNGVKEELKNTNEIIQNLREELSKLKNHENEITAYKLQAEMQETEFLLMREAEQNFLQQIETISTEVHQLREENEQLRNRNRNGIQNEE